MLFMASIGATLITLFWLEKQGKISLNTWIITGILLGICAWGVWKIMQNIITTFL